MEKQAGEQDNKTRDMREMQKREPEKRGEIGENEEKQTGVPKKHKWVRVCGSTTMIS